MKIQYKHQRFQADAARAVVDVFAGQPCLASSYTAERGDGTYQLRLDEGADYTIWGNHPVVPELSDARILENLRAVQRSNQIETSEKLEGRADGYNLTVEMETGVGKTYTYIKTMYELNRAYGWSKYIIVVPSIAIREGVYKSLEMTRDHFAGEYGKKIRFFCYDSSRLNEIDRFASDNSINVMIINCQAFNVRSNSRSARNIYRKLDKFRSRSPIEIIAKTNPVLIIDEPQSLEGKQTKARMKEFNPLLTLRYSATHKPDSVYNMVYRLDAMDAYNKRLVKKIAVKGITETGSSAAESYVYLESVNLSAKEPTATLHFDVKLASGVKSKARIVKKDDNLYELSGGLEEYRGGYVVTSIDGRDNSVEFRNGVRLYAGDATGRVGEDTMRRIQIRETILTHIQRERQLFRMGIKVLSLFFIDEVANYREYDASGTPLKGKYAVMFEEEYEDIIDSLRFSDGETDYKRYLDSISPSDTHAGYFSIDSGRMTNCVTSSKKDTSDDVSAYDLIMKNKELLLDRDAVRSPVRFIFSHSALREGWDNPNVFQICTLKQSASDIRKRQEVGRGLRLCVNQNGERMDEGTLGNDVHNVNVLTVIASESYDSFSKGLQTEIAADISYRPRSVTAGLFEGRTISDNSGNKTVIDRETASVIHYYLIINGYIDPTGFLTDKYYADRAAGAVKVADKVSDYAADVIKIIDSVYDARGTRPENARSSNIELNVVAERLAMPEFKALWSRICTKSFYTVDFDSDALVSDAADALNSGLHVSGIYYRVETGSMNTIGSREDLVSGAAFTKENSGRYSAAAPEGSNLKYDLIGKLVDETGLTRKTAAAILRGLRPDVFGQFRINPEEFIIKAAAIINERKAAAVIEHITYKALDERFGQDILTGTTVKGRLGVNAAKAGKHLYDHIVFDSANERDFAEELDACGDVAVYIKLPPAFFIATPVGRYNPDWAVAFHDGSVRHVYFVAETKGTESSLQLRPIEQSKIHCAREHFKAISGGDVVYDVVDSFRSLAEKAGI